MDTFIEDVASLVSSIDDEYEITNQVAARLSGLLASDYRLPPEVTRPSNEHHVMYPLYIAPDDSWSLASVVWNVGQRTPVHGHETWGVVGIYAGAERELRYVKPAASEPGRALTPAGEQVWERGQVTVCCTTDDDVHAVAAVGDEPTVGILSVHAARRQSPMTARPRSRTMRPAPMAQLGRRRWRSLCARSPERPARKSS